jgi:hypothetical protein
MSDGQVVRVMAYALLDRIWYHILCDSPELVHDSSRDRAHTIIREAQERIAMEIKGFSSRLEISNFNSLTREI